MSILFAGMIVGIVIGLLIGCFGTSCYWQDRENRRLRREIVELRSRASDE